MPSATDHARASAVVVLPEPYGAYFKSVGVLQSVLQLVVTRNDRAEHACGSILVIPLQIRLLASDFDL